MPANVQKMAYVGEQPWWIGTGEDRGQAKDLGANPVTAAEMLEASGLDWEVQVAPLAAHVSQNGKNERFLEVPNMNAIIRSDSHQVLGVVTRRYEPVQNVKSFAFFDDVIGPKQAVYHTAGALGIGERVWILAKLPQSVKINGTDRVDNYILLSNGHDGNSAFIMQDTRIRVVCENTLNMALHGRARHRFNHLNGIGKKLDAKDAREALGLAGESFKEFSEQAGRVAQTAIDEQEMEAFLQRLFPIPKYLLLPAVTKTARSAPARLLMLPEPKQELLMPEFSAVFKHRDAVRQLALTGKGNSDRAVAGTRWTAFNGATEYADYVHGWDSRRTKSLLFGYGRQIKQQAWDLLQVPA